MLKGEGKRYDKDLTWKEEGKFIFLLYKGKKTKVMIERSHEGYNHFALYYIKFEGKVTGQFTVKEKEAALGAGMALFWDKVGEALLKNRNMEK
jgi:hypothetical protein